MYFIELQEITDELHEKTHYTEFFFLYDNRQNTELRTNKN